MTQDNKDTKLNISNSNKHDVNKAVDKSKKVKKKEVVPDLMTRVIIRQLPPTMTEEQFIEDVSPLPEYSDFYYVTGDLSLGEFAFSRAYFKFTNFDELLIFKDKFDDYVFMDSKGNEFPAIVEYAPLQKMPRRFGDSKQTKQDIKLNTIESDPDYIMFIEELKSTNSTSPPPYSADALLEEIQNNKSKGNDSQLTPLLEFLIKKREEKFKMKEEKKRKKDEAKKKKNEEKKVNKEQKAKEQQIKCKVAKSPVERKPKQEATYVIKVNTDEKKVKPAGKSAAAGTTNAVAPKEATAGNREKKGDNDQNTKPARIRNKDRPAREIYRPGGKPKGPAQPIPFTISNTTTGQSEAPTTSKPPKATEDGEKKVSNAAKGNNQSKFKNRVFTKTKN